MRLIDLDALIVEFNKRCCGDCCCCTEDHCGSGNDGCGCRVIDDAPTVDAVPLEDYRSMERTVNKLTKAIADAEPKHGHWVFNGEPIEKWSHGNYCSVCGEYSETCGNYCPYCGAEMDDVEDE